MQEINFKKFNITNNKKIMLNFELRMKIFNLFKNSMRFFEKLHLITLETADIYQKKYLVEICIYNVNEYTVKISNA